MEFLQNGRKWVEYWKNKHSDLKIQKCSKLFYSKKLPKVNEPKEGVYYCYREKCTATIGDIYGGKLDVEVDTMDVFKRDNFEKLVVECDNERFLLYGENNSASDMDHLSEDLKKEIFWIKNIRSQLDEIMPPGVVIHGVTTAMANFGSAYTSAPPHVEDVRLWSMNVHLDGAPKIWLFQDVHKFYYWNTLLTPSRRQCKQEIFHKNFHFDRELYEEHGQEYDIGIQRKGDWVFTFSNSSHAVFNVGNNFTVAKNWCGIDWFRFAREVERCTCRKALEFEYISRALYGPEKEMKMVLTFPKASVMKREAFRKALEEKELDEAAVLGDGPSSLNDSLLQQIADAPETASNSSEAMLPESIPCSPCQGGSAVGGVCGADYEDRILQRCNQFNAGTLQQQQFEAAEVAPAEDLNDVVSLKMMLNEIIPAQPSAEEDTEFVAAEDLVVSVTPVYFVPVVVVPNNPQLLSFLDTAGAYPEESLATPNPTIPSTNSTIPATIPAINPATNPTNPVIPATNPVPDYLLPFFQPSSPSSSFPSFPTSNPTNIPPRPARRTRAPKTVPDRLVKKKRVAILVNEAGPSALTSDGVAVPLGITEDELIEFNDDYHKRKSYNAKMRASQKRKPNPNDAPGKRERRSQNPKLQYFANKKSDIRTKMKKKTVKLQQADAKDVLEQEKLQQEIQVCRERITDWNRRHLLAYVCYCCWDDAAVDARLKDEKYTPFQIIQQFVSVNSRLQRQNFVNILIRKVYPQGERQPACKTFADILGDVDAWKKIVGIPVGFRVPADDPVYL
uniref:JmjC domain-containing protein n=1 Tax=Panagrolaimus sp. ES5 TaxID=591445 RepID=A0AC34G0Y1_9BILA